jgi:hypothetical protein
VHLTAHLALSFKLTDQRSLYGCATWSPTLSEKHRWRVCENRVLRRIFVSKREEVVGG